MSPRKRPDDNEPATKGELRAVRAQLDAILEAVEWVGTEASEIGGIQRDVRELREIVEDLALLLEDPQERAERVAEARGFTEWQIRQIVVELREKLDGTPTREQAAKALGTSEPTLARAMRDLKMGSWPPAPPED